MQHPGTQTTTAETQTVTKDKNGEVWSWVMWVIHIVALIMCCIPLYILTLGPTTVNVTFVGRLMLKIAAFLVFKYKWPKRMAGVLVTATWVFLGIVFLALGIWLIYRIKRQIEIMTKHGYFGKVTKLLVH